MSRAPHDVICPSCGAVFVVSYGSNRVYCSEACRPSPLGNGGRPDDCELDTSWMREGACRDTDPDVFFPERGQPTAPAKDCCAGCVVREVCLDYALTTGVKLGIWGGKSERERRAIRRQQRQGREVA